MNYINLNVKKDTFRKYLLEIGVNVRINNYYEFIKDLKAFILSDFLDHSLDIMYIEYLFGEKIPPLSSFANMDEIKYVTEKYLIDLINKKDFSKYFSEYEDNIDYDTMVYAYKVRVIEHFNIYGISRFLFEFINKEFPNYFKRTVYESKIMYILQNNYIYLSKEEKEYIFNNIIEKMKDFYFKDFNLNFLRLDDSRNFFFLININEEKRFDLLVQFFKEKTFINGVPLTELYYVHLETLGVNDFFKSEKYDLFLSKIKDICNGFKDKPFYENEKEILNYIFLEIFIDKNIVFSSEYNHLGLEYLHKDYFLKYISPNKEVILTAVDEYIQDYGLDNIKYIYTVGDNRLEFTLEDINNYINDCYK